MASEEQNIKAAYSYQRAVEQIIGREGETATLLLRCLVSLNLRVAVSPHVNSAVRLLVVKTDV